MSQTDRERIITEQLSTLARQLSDDMWRLSNRLRNDPSAIVNALGEVQDSGMRVDRLCIELSILRQIREESE